MVAVYKDKGNESAYIPFLWVDESCQGRGISKVIMTYLHDILQKEGYRTIGLEVNKNNTRAFNLYSRMGYLPKEDRGAKFLMEKIL